MSIAGRTSWKDQPSADEPWHRFGQGRFKRMATQASTSSNDLHACGALTVRTMTIARKCPLADTTGRQGSPNWRGTLLLIVGWNLQVAI